MQLIVVIIVRVIFVRVLGLVVIIKLISLNEQRNASSLINVGNWISGTIVL